MTGRPGGTPERPAIFFADAAEFRVWLEENHATASELWMGLAKKHVSPRGLTWADAVVEALCFGWIDSVAQRIDDDFTRQRWTPRKKGSTWSNINVAHVERLLAQGRMAPAGIAAYEARTPGRTGTYSFEQDAVEFSPEHAAALASDPAASAFWAAATATYRKAATHWVNSAKRPATRDQRMATLVADSAAGRLIPPQRYGEPPRWQTRAAEAARAAI